MSHSSSPHPEEARRAVSKDAPAPYETSFETRAAPAPQDEGPRNSKPAYNSAYLDEQTKRMIRRALLKAVAIPGYQVPFGSREMPLARGWG
ncbi:alpha-D-ribose 1-methylphosphonate 5-phosphate C-P-lyase PhnJ, partial [Escherichia coli]|uniref:alpha-D-ribose 1-methylphosphonate 5-phosphate C-P-lyase PhnJ n=1 Tax=Escherichia coli TaxID=562 RepID=UPI00201FA453